MHHHGNRAYFEARLSYTVAVIVLAEGPRLISNIVGATAPLRIDMPVILAIEREGGIALARLTPAWRP